MKKKILYIVACIIAVLLTACLSKEFCNPVDYSENAVNTAPEVLCESNHLCGKKSNIDWNKEGELLKLTSLIFFQITGQDTIPLGMEDNKFYMFVESMYGKEFTLPILFSDYDSDTKVLRIALNDDMASEEKEKIYTILSNAACSQFMIKGAIRFYKSKDDPYFNSEHDYLPEFVISNANDIFNYLNY